MRNVCACNGVKSKEHVHEAKRNTISLAVIYIMNKGEDINVCEELHRLIYCSYVKKSSSRKYTFVQIYFAEITVKPDLRSLSTNGVMLVFGQGDFGQLGLGEDVTEKMRPAAISEYQDIIAIAAGAMHNVCLRKTGEILTFGCNDEGALGRDTTKEGSETVPGTVELPEKAIQVTAGDSHTAALLEDGRVFAWGTFRVCSFY